MHSELSTAGYLKRKETSYSLAIPVTIILITLIITTGRDLLVFHKRKAYVDQQNAQAAAVLMKAATQVKALQTLRKDLGQLAVDDPVAQKIMNDFFPQKDPLAAPHSGPNVRPE